MSKIYAMSDIHGCYDAMMKSLEYIKLEPSDLIVFLGDYVDIGKESFKVLKEIMRLEKKYPNQIIILLGNHDEWLIEWLFSREKNLNFYGIDVGRVTVKSFLEEAEYQMIIDKIQIYSSNNEKLTQFNSLLHKKIIESEKYKNVLNWLRLKNEEKRYFETDNQIFVHAGIDEEAEEFWKVGTSDDIFTEKYPATKGKFYKDVISGHIYSHEVAGDQSYLGFVYWDESSHYFIDGHTTKSNIVPVIRYDIETLKYSFLNTSNGDWENYTFR